MRSWLWVAMLVLAVRPGAAQSLLPASFAGWQAIAGSATTKAPLEQVDPADASLLRACHEQTAERQSYKKGEATLTVIVYWMGDPSYAYSAYSFLRPEAATDFRPTPHASIGSKRAVLLVGNLLVEVDGQNLPAAGRDLAALVAALKPRASDEPYPTLWQFLPTDRLLPHSDRYALDNRTLALALGADSSKWTSGDWMGFDDDAEAEVGRYEIRGQHAMLILASYPTQQLAAEHLSEIERQFAVNPKPGTSGGRPVLYARRLGSFIGLVSGAVGAAEAQSLLSQIRYQTEVTWNAPTYLLKDLTMPQYVVGIIVGTIVIVIFTLVSGIALGMIRIAVKHYMPGLVFDRHHSMEIIQLGLTTKPIDVADFYFY
jgi:hypothetical protein